MIRGKDIKLLVFSVQFSGEGDITFSNFMREDEHSGGGLAITKANAG